MKNYGLKIDPIGEEDYVFGGFGTLGEEINFSGNWLDWLPKQEVQKIDGADTWACTTFGTLNCVEILLKFMGMEKNFSDRFLAIGSGTEMNVGNSPHTVAEYLRHNGVCTEELLPMPKTIDEFYTPSPLPIELEINAKKFIDAYDFTHAYIFNNNKTLKEKQGLLIDALRRSPVGISVTAWIFGEQYYFKTHFILIGVGEIYNTIVLYVYNSAVIICRYWIAVSAGDIYSLMPIYVQKFIEIWVISIPLKECQPI